MIITQFYNGEARSPYDGIDATDNLDVHTRIGTAQCQKALASESTTPNEECVQAESTNGDVYFFSIESGKTWKRTSAGSYSLVNTNANGSHRGARYFNGKIYYWTSSKVGHFDLSSTWTNSAHTLSNSNGQGGEVVNDVLFIADGKYIASITSGGTFTANSLDIPAEYTATDLIGWNARLLIGTVVGSNVSRSKVFMWDTYSSTWTVDDDVFEIGINTFVRVDNFVLAQCGTGGNLYLWNGSQMELFRKIRNVTTSVSVTSHARKNVFNGVALLGIGSDIYSVHRADRDMPYAITHEYTTTAESVRCIAVSGSTLLVSTGANIDAISANYATAKITTPIIKARDIDGVFKVKYESMPSNCSLSLESNVNGAGWISETGFKKDTQKMEYWLENGITYSGDINFLQLRITMTPATTSTPIIQEIQV